MNFTDDTKKFVFEIFYYQKNVYGTIEIHLYKTESNAAYDM